MRRFIGSAILVLLPFACWLAYAAPRKAHSVILGAVKKVPYSKVGDPSGAAPGEDSLKIRALIVDGVLKEWTTGDAHDITDRSFVVRRAIRLNDALPSDKPDQSPPERPAHGCGSAGRGCWSIARPAISPHFIFLTTIPA